MAVWQCGSVGVLEWRRWGVTLERYRYADIPSIASLSIQCIKPSAHTYTTPLLRCPLVPVPVEKTKTKTPVSLPRPMISTSTAKGFIEEELKGVEGNGEYYIPFVLELEDEINE